MTCLERYLKDYRPGYNEDDLDGIIDSVCPSDYGYLPSPIDCETASMSCEDCWNREITDYMEENKLKNPLNITIEDIAKVIDALTEKGVAMQISLCPIKKETEEEEVKDE